MRKVRNLLAIGAAAAGLLAAGAASAVPVWYADIQTSTLLGNLHGDITALSDPGGIAQLLQNASVDHLGAGLGSGYVSTSAPLSITHTFAPDGFVAGVVHSATVTVMVVDDLDFNLEYGQIALGSDVLDGGSALFNFFGGDVSAHVTSAGDAFTLSVQATRGDFRVVFSALSVHFDGSLPLPSPAIPEPTAALAFAAGLAVVLRRR